MPNLTDKDRPQSASPTGIVCTFYSYKGGVGRSMALANVAALLARYGKKVLIVDWDLEAPGLEKYFGSHLSGSRLRSPGLLEWIEANAAGKSLDWRECLISAAIPRTSANISILHAGREEPSYFDRVSRLNWEELFKEKDLGRRLDAMRDQWIAEFDFVLIDSRTGVTDIGGICSILMPDYLICLFTTNDQSVLGIKNTMIQARKAHAELPVDRRKLMVIPVPARDESNTEYELAATWRKKFAHELSEFYMDWLPKGVDPEHVLDFLKIPYVAYWSFGEKLPVLEEEADNPQKLAYSYGILARLLNSKLDWDEVRGGKQAAEAEAAQRAEAAKRAAEAARVREEAQRTRSEKEREKAEANARYAHEAVMERYKAVSQRLRWIYRAAGGVAVFFAMWLFGALYTLLERGALWPQEFMIKVYSVILVETAIIVLSWFIFRRYRRRFNNLEIELTSYHVDGGPYRGADVMTSARLFAARIEKIARGELEEGGHALAPAEKSKTDGELEAMTQDIADFVVRQSRLASAREVEISLADDPMPTASGASKAGAEQDRASADVMLSFAYSPVMAQWLDYFSTLLSHWLGDALARDVAILDGGREKGGFEDNLNRIRNAGMAVVFASNRYVRSQSTQKEFAQIAEAIGPGRIIVIALDRDLDVHLLPGLFGVTVFDFSHLVLVGEGFSKTDAYVEFQMKVREVASAVAKAIGSIETGATPRLSSSTRANGAV